MIRFFRDAPRWIVLATLVFAPWFYGGTTEQGIVAITCSLGGATLLWICALPFGGRERRSPLRTADATASVVRYSATLWTAVVAILLLGWWMVLNAKTIYDSDFALFVDLRQATGALPGSVDQALSAAWMLRATALLGAVCIVADASRNVVWLSRFCVTSAAVGGSISLLGMVQKATRAPMIFWHEVDQPVTTFFGPFYYHGNAGAFLNLTLPVTLGLAYRAFTRRSSPLSRALWSTVAFLNTIAVFANTSRMGHALALATLLATSVMLLRKPSTEVAGMRWMSAAVGAVLLFGAVYLVSETVAVDRSLKRWTEGSGTTSVDARWISSQVALRAVPDAAWFGFGPGTFHVVFPYYTASLSDRLTGFWRYLHEDYLQTFLEWGGVGSALWACLFFGGMATAVRARMSLRAKTWRPRQRILLLLVVLALTTVALHALVDFPLQIASIQLYVAMYLGICWSAPAWGEAD